MNGECGKHGGKNKAVLATALKKRASFARQGPGRAGNPAATRD